MNISNRAKHLLTEDLPLVTAHFKCADDPFTSSNKNGYLNFGTAENFLMDKELNSKIEEILTSSTPGLHYNSPQGKIELRQAYSKYLKKFFGFQTISLDNIAFASGASAILEMISYCLFDPNDEIIVPTPLYNGFYHDLQTRFGAKLVHSNSMNENSFDLEIFEKDIQSNKKLKSILITNPHNPTGYVLTKNEVESIILLAKKYHLFIISDEIYGNSVYADRKFYSFLDPVFDDLNYSENIVHVYGMAKDFCASGLKVGVSYTKNENLAKLLAGTSFYHTISTSVQTIAEAIFSDLNWCDSFFKDNQKRLSETSSSIQKALNNNNINTFKAYAGIFLFADFSKKFDIDTTEKEIKFFEVLMNQHKINITPGNYCASEKPGQFRICFAKDKASTDELIKRLNNI